MTKKKPTLLDQSGAEDDLKEEGIVSWLTLAIVSVSRQAPSISMPARLLRFASAVNSSPATAICSHHGHPQHGIGHRFEQACRGWDTCFELAETVEQGYYCVKIKQSSSSYYYYYFVCHPTVSDEPTKFPLKNDDTIRQFQMNPQNISLKNDDAIDAYIHAHCVDLLDPPSQLYHSHSFVRTRHHAP